YPMTPATGVLMLLSQEQNKTIINKISGKSAPIVMTPESEISVINMALGASFAGRRVMVGTSGGGFDLMTEGLSLQGMMELPIVIHLAQRIGAATGVPTYTGQGDLNVALYGGHGEFSRLVIAPGDPAEAYEKTREAFYLAEQFGLGAIILTDKHVLESDFTQELPEVKLEIPKRKLILGKDIIKKNSYEHDEAGNTTEDEKVIVDSFQRREKREKLLKEECRKLINYKTFGSGHNLIIST
ncbi:pyruvate ferredoxin oxidoreductase, partial [Candidatus Woesearchaeota archaeon]|nr:pyruvate ferredoxin oxidoreductase [Candidatus Woesearchaeota archaeon]